MDSDHRADGVVDGGAADVAAAAVRSHAADECCDIVTIGRRSGRPHRVEIWFGVVGDTLYLISGNGPGAHWYANALAAGTIEVHFDDGVAVGGHARPVVDPAERRRIGELMGPMYPWDGDPSIGLTFDAWCFDVPALAVEGWWLLGAGGAATHQEV